MSELHFIRPLWLLAIIPGALWLIYLLKHKPAANNWAKLCDAELLPFILQPSLTINKRLNLVVTTVVFLLIITAIAGPALKKLPLPVFHNNTGLVIILDLSQSMAATDLSPNRLVRARYKIIDILSARKNAQTALVVYAGAAFVVSPLTNDSKIITSQISALTTDLLPVQGNNIQAAINKAKVLLQQKDLQQGDILLVGGTVNAPINTAPYRLSILGVGGEQEVPIKHNDGGFMRDAADNILLTRLDPSYMAQIAKDNGGTYQTISASDQDIKAILALINKPIKVDNIKSDIAIDQWQDLGVWLMWLIVPLSAFSLRKFAKGLITLTLVIILPLPNPSFANWWQTKDQVAQTKFNKQEYKAAAQEFKDSKWRAAAQYKARSYAEAVSILKNAVSATDLYNLANALAKLGKYPEAIKNYRLSLQIESKNPDAIYNLKQVEKLLKSSLNDKQQDKNDQSKEQENNNNHRQKIQNNKSAPTAQEKVKSRQSDLPAELADKDQNTNQSATIARSREIDESNQSSELLLQKILDNPGGMLKRKFLYQYGKPNIKLH